VTHNLAVAALSFIAAGTASAAPIERGASLETGVGELIDEHLDPLTPDDPDAFQFMTCSGELPSASAPSLSSDESDPAPESWTEPYFPAPGFKPIYAADSRTANNGPGLTAQASSGFLIAMGIVLCLLSNRGSHRKRRALLR
jgi:hypothetical protein